MPVKNTKIKGDNYEKYVNGYSDYLGKGVWLGSMCQRFGVPEGKPINNDQLQRILQGRHPITGEVLLESMKKTKKTFNQKLLEQSTYAQKTALLAAKVGWEVVKQENLQPDIIEWIEVAGTTKKQPVFAELDDERKKKIDDKINELLAADEFKEEIRQCISDRFEDDVFKKKRFGKVIWPEDVSAQNLPVGALHAYLDAKIGHKEIGAEEEAEKKGKARTQGLDFTCSAPKSVSLLFAFGNDGHRKEIQGAQDAAVKAVVAFLERQCLLTRTGKHTNALGDTEQVSKLIAGAYTHFESRANDPMLHTHLVVPNLLECMDEKFRTIWLNDLVKWNKAIGAVYHTELAYQMKELGYGITAKGEKQVFDITGVPDDMMEHFSKRSKEIKEAVAEHEADGNLIHDEVAAKQEAAKTSRAKKAGLSLDELTEAWKEEAQDNGFDLNPNEIKGGRSIGTSFNEGIDFKNEDALQYHGDGWSKGIIYDEKRIADELAEDSVVFTEKDLFKKVGIDCVDGSVPASEIYNRVENIKRNHLFEIQVGSETRYSSAVAAARELALVDTIKSSRGAYKKHAIMDFELKWQAKKLELKAKGIVLNDVQEGMVRHCCTSGDLAVLVEGWAGTGKTFSAKIIKEMYEAEGYKVVGSSTANKAVDGLKKDAGIEGSSIVKTLMGADKAKEWLLELEKNKAEIEGKRDDFIAKVQQEQERERMAIAEDFRILLKKGESASKSKAWLKEQEELYKKAAAERNVKNEKYLSAISDKFSLGIKKFEDGILKEAMDAVVFDEKTIMLIDEVAMLPDTLLQETVERMNKAGGRIIGIGDTGQLPSPSRGGSYRAVVDAVGAFQLNKVMRQKVHDEHGNDTKKENAEEIEALSWIRNGDGFRTMEYFEEKGRVHIAKDAVSKIDSMVNLWLGKGHEDGVMLASTNAEVEAVIKNARTKLKEKGVFKSEDIIVQTKYGAMPLAEGDSIILRAPLMQEPTEAHKLKLKLQGKKARAKKVLDNGTQVKVVEVRETKHGDKITIQWQDIENGRKITKTHTFSSHKFNSFQHSYCLTNYLSQGMTVKHAHVLSGIESKGMVNKEMMYVAASRHKDEVHIHLDDESFGTATRRASFYDMIGRSGAKEMLSDQFKAKYGESWRAKMEELLEGKDTGMTTAKERHKREKNLLAAKEKLEEKERKIKAQEILEERQKQKLELESSVK